MSFSRLHYPLILGMDFLREHKTNIDLNSQTLNLYNGLSRQSLTNQGQEDGMVATVAINVRIPARSQCMIPVRVPKADGEQIFLEGHPTFTSRTMTMYQVCNPTNSAVEVTAGCMIAHAEPVVQGHVCALWGDDGSPQEVVSVASMAGDQPRL